MRAFARELAKASEHPMTREELVAFAQACVAASRVLGPTPAQERDYVNGLPMGRTNFMYRGKIVVLVPDPNDQPTPGDDDTMTDERPTPDIDALLRIQYATQLGILDPYDTPPCWDEIIDQAKEEGRWAHAKEHAAFKEAIALLLGMYADQHTSEQLVSILSLELRIGRAALRAAQVSQRRADDLRAALGSLLHYKPKRYSMYRDEELLALAARRAGSPLWRLVTRALA